MRDPKAPNVRITPAYDDLSIMTLVGGSNDSVFIHRDSPHELPLWLKRETSYDDGLVNSAAALAGSDSHVLLPCLLVSFLSTRHHSTKSLMEKMRQATERMLSGEMTLSMQLCKKDNELLLSKTMFKSIDGLAIPSKAASGVIHRLVPNYRRGNREGQLIPHFYLEISISPPLLELANLQISASSVDFMRIWCGAEVKKGSSSLRKPFGVRCLKIL